MENMTQTELETEIELTSLEVRLASSLGDKSHEARANVAKLVALCNAYQQYI